MEYKKLEYAQAYHYSISLSVFTMLLTGMWLGLWWYILPDNEFRKLIFMPYLENVLMASLVIFFFVSIYAPTIAKKLFNIINIIREDIQKEEDNESEIAKIFSWIEREEIPDKKQFQQAWFVLYLLLWIISVATLIFFLIFAGLIWKEVIPNILSKFWSKLFFPVLTFFLFGIIGSAYAGVLTVNIQYRYWLNQQSNPEKDVSEENTE